MVHPLRSFDVRAVLVWRAKPKGTFAMQPVIRACVLLAAVGLIVNSNAWAKGEGKGKGQDKDVAAAAPTAADASSKDKAERKAEREKKKEDTAAARAAEAAREAGGDESELNTLATELNLSDQQKKEVGKEFEKYRAKLTEINALPDGSAKEKLFKGPQRRALREDLDKWIKGNISPAQAQKYEAYAKKREKDLFDEHLDKRLSRMNEALHLNDNQQAKLRTIYGEQLRGIQDAADALYAASKKAGAATADLEKQLESKRDALKTMVEGVLKPEQIDLFKKMDD